MRTRALLAVLIALFLGACGGESTDTTNETITIAVIPKGTIHSFWVAIHAGAMKAAEELGVEVIWKGPGREDDREAQIAEVETFISRGVSGIVLAPTDDKALRIPVMNATRSGIPVVLIDSALDSDDYVSFVATDNYQGGRLAGERMVEVLGGEGRVMMLRYMEGSASTMKREDGFMDVMAENPTMEIVSSNQHAGATAELAYQASENLLGRFKDAEGNLEVDGIYCPNEGSAFGMLRALQDGGLAGSVTFIGFDASEQMVRGLENGEFDSLVLQDPVNMAYLGVKTMVAHLRGESVEKRVNTGVTLVTGDNMNEPRMQELLRPDVDRWLN
ncbi:MAG: substrate-binding domain-containing protein [Acidobacteriota bacterium]|nr:MAG: substrate-binding domain-containing protein [Acidobacteriota bacterium]